MAPRPFDRATALSSSTRRGGPAGTAAQQVSIALGVTGIAVLIAGFVWPHAADALLRTLLATLAIGFVVARAYRSVEPVLAMRNRYSPFGRPTAERTPAVAPWPLRKLTTDLGAANGARSARRTAIPASATKIVRREAERRLADRHGLNLNDPAHHHRVRSLVSEPLWLLIRPHDPRARSEARPTTRSRTVPLSRLDRILDDLEAL